MTTQVELNQDELITLLTALFDLRWNERNLSNAVLYEKALALTNKLEPLAKDAS